MGLHRQRRRKGLKDKRRQFMDDKVVAVVVTYNRKQYLEKCLTSLLGQTRSIEKILLIDNASTDGTLEFLRDNHYLDNPKIAYRGMTKNTGGAGGFKAGLQHALLEECAWFWLMDDDVAPEPDCLENLLKYKELSECIHPRRVLPDNQFVEWEQYLDVSTATKTNNGDASFKNGKQITFTNVGCFEGMLVSRRIVQMIGLPDEDYFINDDDTLYGLKASSHTNVCYIAAASMKKLIPISDSPPWKSYYVIRNRFYLRHDGIRYFNITPRKKEDAMFILGQLIEVAGFFLKGRRYFLPTLRGFFHGLRRSKNMQREPGFNIDGASHISALPK